MNITTTDSIPAAPAQCVTPKTKLEAALDLIAAQNDYIEASKEHIALLDKNISYRDGNIQATGRGYPITYIQSEYLTQSRQSQEKASAEHLAGLAARVAEAQAVFEGVKET